MFEFILKKIKENKKLKQEQLRLQSLRDKCDQSLQDFYQKHALNTSSNKGPFLLDARWDNPNYWARYTLLRAALVPYGAKEIGFLGPYRRVEQTRTLRNLGIHEFLDFNEIKKKISGVNANKALEICQNCASADDLLKIKLPFGVDPRLMYDCILKKQSQPQVSINDPNLKLLIEDYLDEISIADYTLNKVKPEVLISSHVTTVISASAWLALERGIKVIVPAGDNGVSHYFKVVSPNDVFDYANRPKLTDLTNITEDQKLKLNITGSNYLNHRFKGKTTNAGATFAYNERPNKISRSELCEKFSWDPQKPIIGIYCSVWIDFPHTFGMSNFRDFLDWLTSILEVAKTNTNIQWLFKSHPTSHLYEVTTLQKYFDENSENLSHIALAENTWHGESMLNAIDAVVTYHGTIGVEAAAHGKPVLIADMGWYHDWPFCIFPKNRHEFLNLIQEKWWQKLDLVSSKKYAEIFAGWYWGRPSWQKNMVYRDDNYRWDLYPDLIRLFTCDKNKDELLKEVSEIEAWLKTDKLHFHPFKMSRAQDYLWNAP